LDGILDVTLELIYTLISNDFRLLE